MTQQADLSQIAKLQDQLASLYGNLPIQTKSDFELIRERIQSGEGSTSIKDLCVYHGVCTATIYNWIERGDLPRTVKIGGSVRFKNSELRAMEQS